MIVIECDYDKDNCNQIQPNQPVTHRALLAFNLSFLLTPSSCSFTFHFEFPVEK